MERPQLTNDLFNLLRMAGTPVVMTEQEGSQYVLSAGNILTRALELKKFYKKMGIGSDDIVSYSPKGLASVIIILESIISNRTLAILNDSTLHSFTNDLNIIGDEISGREVYSISVADPMVLEVDDIDIKRIGRYCAPDNTQFLLATSGSSAVIDGKLGYKLVPLSPEVIYQQINEHIKVLNIVPETTRIITLPLSHGFGLILDFLVGIFSRQTIIFAELNQLIEKIEEADDVCLVPRTLQFVWKNLRHRYLPRLRVLVGGASVPEYLKQAKFCKVIEGYGMTECGPGLCVNGKILGDRRIRLREVDSNIFHEFKSDQELPDGLFHLDIHFSSLSHAEYFEKLLPDSYFATRDIISIRAGNLSILGRDVDVRKGLTGEWTTLSAIQDDIKKQFGLDVIFGGFKEKQELLILNQTLISDEARNYIEKVIGDVDYSFHEINLDHYLQFGRGKELRDAVLRDLK